MVVIIAFVTVVIIFVNVIVVFVVVIIARRLDKVKKLILGNVTQQSQTCSELKERYGKNSVNSLKFSGH